MATSSQAVNRYAIVVGINYVRKLKGAAQLEGCQNDAQTIKDMLTIEFGMKLNQIQVLTDDPKNSVQPTGKVIKMAISKMVDDAKKGDQLFFFFSGHGGKYSLFEKYKGHQFIVPSDGNQITDVDFRRFVNTATKKNATLTIMSDSCNSGGLINNETLQIGPRVVTDTQVTTVSKMLDFELFLEGLASASGLTDNTDIGAHMVHIFGEDSSELFLTPPEKWGKITVDQGILLSACGPKEQANEVWMKNPGIKSGAFTVAVANAVHNNKGPQKLTNSELVVAAGKLMETYLNKLTEDGQHPCLYSSAANSKASFLGL